MLVDGETLDVAPAADQLLEAAAGELTDEFANGEIAWNNELALHVIELKCNGPRPSLAGLGKAFAANVKLANDKLGREGLRLMPTAMHPWMDPNDVKLWPHGTRVIYDTFDRIFSCKGHGWANLQSMQINLPFAGDEEFARLHAAIRFLLPILPGLAASSPIVDGERNGILDNRLVVYRSNCARIPSITGEVVPGARGLDRRVPRARARADLPRPRAARSRRRPAPRVGQRSRRDRALRPHGDRDPRARRAGDARHGRRLRRADRRGAESAVRRAMARPRADELAGAPRSSASCSRSRRGKARVPASATSNILAAFGMRSSGTELKGLWEHLIETISARGSLAPETGRLLEHYLRHGTLATRIGKAVGLLADTRQARESLRRALRSARRGQAVRAACSRRLKREIR